MGHTKPSNGLRLGRVERLMHAFGIIGGVAFGMNRRSLCEAGKALAALGLVETKGAHSGQNRSAYNWYLTPAGSALLGEMVRAGFYPLAHHTDFGRAALKDGAK